MARSNPSSTQSNPDSRTQCTLCGAVMKRSNDLPRHLVLHAENKEEFMYSCPVEGCTHQTLQKSNLATHIRTHTRAKPHKCPEYFPNGQKCDFATADPSSLHRHRKRKHGHKASRSSTATSATPAASGSTRQASVSSLESEESFGLRPETSDADVSTTERSPENDLSNSIHTPYLTASKDPTHCHDYPYHPPLDLEVPEWIDEAMQWSTAAYNGQSFSESANREFLFELLRFIDISDTSILDSWAEWLMPDPKSSIHVSTRAQPISVYLPSTRRTRSHLSSSTLSSPR
ncbi:hypothetical protein B0H15DRAFT_252504 [Mycena belliarum]|uniref:C2H2-type domain-containing protein n=1 Tax=Mycena belliarum TaxID=1033014 RepID=A0AAD6U634_9AGAR|nr:hypothetical protein B0H15DRAFT_252504 [Mycena belliae]